MAEPNQLRQAAVPNTIGAAPPQPGISSVPGPGRRAEGTALPLADGGRPNDLDELAGLDDLDDLEDLEDLDHSALGAVAALPPAELDRRIREAVETTLADQTRTIAAAKRRGRIGFVAGLLLAAAGIPLFFGASLISEEIGIALICLGVGIALLSVLLAAARSDVAASRRSAATAVATTFFLPHTVLVWIVALGLVAFGLLMLLAAAQTG